MASSSTPGPPAAASLAMGRRSAVKAFLVEWIKLNWADCVCMAAVGGVAYGVFVSPVPVTRTFPITFDGSGDIVYPELAYPFRGWIIAPWASGTLSILGPIVVYLAAQVRMRSAWEASAAMMGSAQAVLLASVFQVVLKQLIGGLRPYFLDVCMPDVSRAAGHNATGLNGVGYGRLMYTTDVCTQPDAQRLQAAVTSFPSGHSTATFAGFGFLFLWMNAKLKVWADHRPAFWKLALTMLPLLLASLIACSLTVDAAHNWYDILAGSLIGLVMALASYRATYAALWDWRFNHMPLRQAEPFPYAAPDAACPARTLTQSAGWGDTSAWLAHRLDSATSSAVFAQRRGGAAAEMTPRPADGGLDHPQQQSGRSKRHPLREGEAV
ncbi:hypothetical protein CDD83_490 [Cordyceps sp. RAO-2017]|nr:hypothetical protein CDD83_490 [Cordyceps sp. RAO-2017]